MSFWRSLLYSTGLVTEGYFEFKDEAIRHWQELDDKIRAEYIAEHPNASPYQVKLFMERQIGSDL